MRTDLPLHSLVCQGSTGRRSFFPFATMPVLSPWYMHVQRPQRSPARRSWAFTVGNRSLLQQPRLIPSSLASSAARASRTLPCEAEEREDPHLVQEETEAHRQVSQCSDVSARACCYLLYLTGFGVVGKKIKSNKYIYIYDFHLAYCLVELPCPLSYVLLTATLRTATTC